MAVPRIESLKIKAKLLQKAKKKAGKDIPLKDALDILAKAAGFKTWREFKEILEATAHFYPGKGTAYWNIWFSSYEEALAALETHPAGYLLPYQKDFFICEADFIESLGIARGEEDLSKVGRNWVEPGDAKAWGRILRKVQARRTA
jgi:hypothetical protein